MSAKISTRPRSRPSPQPYKRFRIIPQENGMTLVNLLIRRLGCSRSEATAMVRAGGAYVNRLRVRLTGVRVATGERVTIYPNAAQHASLDFSSLVVVHREADFMVIDKPCGVPVTPPKHTARGALTEAVIEQLTRDGVNRPYVGALHRLDQGASGLVLLTTRSAANKNIQDQFQDHSIARTYLVRVAGPAPTAGACDAPIAATRNGARIADKGDPHGKPARTRFSRVRSFGGPDADPACSEHLLEVDLETGRTHQIRLHMAHLGYPVVGDHRYGSDADETYGQSSGQSSGQSLGQSTDRAIRSEPSTLCLHAWRLKLRHPSSGAELCFESSPPNWVGAEGAPERNS